MVDKGVLFLILWTLNFGKHHFWLLPNLTKDVGFFASFVPLYEHKTRDDIIKESEKPKKSKPAKESKKKRKAPEEPNCSDEQKNKSEGDEDAKQEQQPQEEGSESSENEKFEIVDDKDLPPILKLDL